MGRRAALIAMIPALIWAGAGWAEGPQPFPDFTFKRIGPPPADSPRRITVQIDPNASLPPAPAPRSPTADIPTDLPGASGYEWFWAQVPPGADTPTTGRLHAALAGLAAAPGGAIVPEPRVQHLQDIAQSHGPAILAATIGTRVSPALVLAVIGVESSGRSGAISPKGATGLMQLMPATAARFGVDDAMVAGDNIRGGVAYLDWLLGEFNGDPVLALAGYNAGEGAVRTYAGVPPYAETRAYVPKVLAAWNVARQLCVTPPELVSDGCVFAVAGLASNS